MTYHKSKNNPKKTKGKATDDMSSAVVFDFGIPGTHLIFSKPVEISINVPGYSDGVTVDLAALHATDTSFNTTGISLDPTTTCINGSASIPGSQAIVRNGKIVFYTCGASSFTMNPVGGVTGSNDIRLVIGDC